MKLEEKKQLLVKMGLTEERADFFLEYEDKGFAVLPTFRFLKPLDDHLEMYKGQYKELLESLVADGSIEKRMPEAATLIKMGASTEAIEKYSYDLVLDAFEFLLYHLDDHKGAEVSKVFLEEDFSQCCYGRLMEVEEDDDEPTGRYLLEGHGLLPLSNC